MVERFQRGETTTFRVLYEKYYRLVRVAVWHHVRSASQVDDLCQEIFLKAFRQMSQLVDGNAFKKWLMRISYTTCIDEGRRKKLPELSLDPEAHGVREDGVPAGAGEESGDRRILQALNVLGPIDGLIVWLHYVEELRFQEVGEIVGMAENAVRQRAYRALHALRKEIP